MGKVCVEVGFEGERARESWSIYEKQIQKRGHSLFKECPLRYVNGGKDIISFREFRLIR